MEDNTTSAILKRQNGFESERSNWEQHWREIAERVLSRQDFFQSSGNITQGAKKTEKQFDSTAPLALERFAAAMESMLTPRVQRWHSLIPKDRKLRQNPEIVSYLEEVTNILFSARYSPEGNFASQIHELYMSLGAFGTGALYIEDELSKGLRYRSIFLGQLYFAEDASGRVDTVHRKFEMTARQIMQRWPNSAPESVSKCLESNPEKKFEVLHAVSPASELKFPVNFAYASYYVLTREKVMLSESGYRTMPYAVSRYSTSPMEIYGRSPAMAVLADIKMVNEMSKSTIKAAHLATEPPLLLREDGALSSFSLKPAHLNFGGLDDAGNQMVRPLEIGNKFNVGETLQEQRRRVINDAFLVTLFQILVETPRMTATEAMLRAQEKGALLAPSMGRQQSELLGPIIERELDILLAYNMIPPPPMDLISSGGHIDVEYLSPVVRAQRAEEGVGILRTLEAIAPLAQIDGSVMSIINVERAARILGEVNGAPISMFNSPEELEAIRQQQQQEMEMKALLEAAPIAASSAKDLAQAQAQMGSAPQQQGALIE